MKIEKNIPPYHSELTPVSMTRQQIIDGAVAVWTNTGDRVILEHLLMDARSTLMEAATQRKDEETAERKAKKIRAESKHLIRAEAEELLHMILLAVRTEVPMFQSSIEQEWRNRGVLNTGSAFNTLLKEVNALLESYGLVVQEHRTVKMHHFGTFEQTSDLIQTIVSAAEFDTSTSELTLAVMRVLFDHVGEHVTFDQLRAVFPPELTEQEFRLQMHHTIRAIQSRAFFGKIGIKVELKTRDKMLLVEPIQ